ncbi:MAG: tRNA adenosine(34) deaminase TadA [Thermodesulfobacteriota bacterium]
MGAKDKDSLFMAEALKEAVKAEKRGEVPVGAVIVHGPEVIARGYNRKETGRNPTLHAEMVAIERAAKKLGSWRLEGATLYVTLEPCLMCMGAVIQARIPGLVFAARDPKAGACGSLYDIANDRRLNHRVKVRAGVGEAEAGAMLKEFFLRLRKKGKG